jgi:hypothetical protein
MYFITCLDNLEIDALGLLIRTQRRWRGSNATLKNADFVRYPNPKKQPASLTTPLDDRRKQ